MRWLVTGASGFIGSHAVRRLADAGCEVYALARSIGTPESNTVSALKTDLFSLKDFIPDEQIDAVFHAAAVAPTVGQDEDALMQVNADGTRAVAEWSMRHNVPHFFHCSSVSLYGNVSGTVDEQTAVRQPDMYGQSKQAAEDYLCAVRADKGAVMLRLPGVIGQGAHNIWLTQVLELLRSNTRVGYYNPKTHFNNAVHVDDLITFAMQLASREPLAKCEPMVLGAEGAIAIKDLLEQMREWAGSTSILEALEEPRPSFTLDASKAKQYGYVPMKITKMVKDYVESA